MNMHQPLDSSFRSRVSQSWASAQANGSRRRLLLIAAVVIVALGAAAWFAFGPSGDATDADAEALANRPSVTVIVPGTTQVSAMVNVTGTVAALRDMPVGVQGEGGAVTAVLVDAGDFVRKGQVLARIDKSVLEQQVRQLQASVVQARADAALAQSELDRALTLVERGFISKADIDRRTATRDRANAGVNVAIAQLNETQARLGRLDIRAPEAGLILERNVEPGQVVSSAGGAAVFRMAQDGIFELQAKVAEQDLVRLRDGMEALVTPVGQAGNTAKGKIWQLSPVVDPQTRQGVARIRLEPNPGLRPGGFASAAIVAGSANAPLLPESAVLSDEKGNFVYIIDADNKVVRRDVTVGEVSSVGITIAKGLKGDEQVVYSAGAFLNPDDIVVPQRLAKK